MYRFRFLTEGDSAVMHVAKTVDSVCSTVDDQMDADPDLGQEAWAAAEKHVNDLFSIAVAGVPIPHGASGAREHV